MKIRWTYGIRPSEITNNADTTSINATVTLEPVLL